jgi:hypothetical protein
MDMYVLCWPSVQQSFQNKPVQYLYNHTTLCPDQILTKGMYFLFCLMVETVCGGHQTMYLISNWDSLPGSKVTGE